MAASFCSQSAAASGFATGARVSSQRPHQSPQLAPRSACRCTCVAFANHSIPEHKQQRAVASSDALLQPAAQDKYERILAFVDAHATPVVLDNSWGSSSSGNTSTSAEQHVTSSWHHSYDEEAEEGEELNEPAVLAYAATVPTAVAESAAAVAVNAALPSWSYGDPMNPKPFFYAWDEEAEGSFELEQVCSTSQSAAAAFAGPMEPAAAAAALRAQRRAALHEARHAARASRRMRRSQLHPQLGDLEHMPAWVQPAQQQLQQRSSSSSSQRSSAGIKYQQLLALVAGDAAHGQYRKPKQWHLTFDEDVHGPEVPETVLGSC